ncbi:MAG TPA: DNA recombination protein RmuC [Brevundimonas sp.]|jgi:DNA recombination protein RmuC|uniref:DNA recombination protein RmuC n=1 Tax=Brevundimonas sp. TaxID=1871086 RepID=UPI002E1085B6|nr:DNA recombination protein RmuC [Brevundimonas sp.]
MNTLVVALALLSLVLAGGLVWAFLGWQAAKAALAAAEQRIVLIEESRRETAEFIKAQSAQSAQAVAEQLVARATETFQAQDRVARERMEAQLKPVAETLKAFQEKVSLLEKERAEQTGGLKEQIGLLMAASSATRDEARRLTEALKGNTGRRGRWGEQTCRNVLESAGMAGRFDFIEQTSTDDEEGRRQRPDFLVRLAGGGCFVIDAKVPVAFGDETDGDEEARAREIGARIALSLKTHVRQLASKGYQDQFRPSPDFVALFVPSEALLSSALDHEPDLLTEAMGSRVVIVTPSTLFALCKAVAYGWRAEEQARNADEVAKLGRQLYQRLSVMGGHVEGLRKALEGAVGKYNQFVGSLESQVMVAARRFEDLHVNHEGKTLEELGPVEQTPRTVARPELTAAEPPERPRLISGE